MTRLRRDEVFFVAVCLLVVALLAYAEHRSPPACLEVFTCDASLPVPSEATVPK